MSEEDTEFISEQVYDTIKAVGKTALTNCVYNDDKIENTCSAIADGCLKELAKLERRVKYTVSVVASQRTGAQLISSVSCRWNDKTDGMCSAHLSNATVDCVITVFVTECDSAQMTSAGQ